ncbi:MAG: AAA family ATPase [Chloroflexi bacterium]|nr:AAA family ATPase [Chloroflexota bacterium]
MLIRFCVENFLSFKDEVEFSMVAGESDKHPDHIHKVRDMRILKTGVIFGANQSGKTNLIKAMSFAQNFITSGSLKTDYLELAPFLLNSESAEKPSEFLFEIQCGIAQCFQYYFSVDRQRVHEESLHEILPEGARMMFERETDSQNHTDVKIGAVPVLVTNDEEPFDFVPQVRQDQLFLSVGNQIEGRIAFLDIIYDWFDRTLVPVFADSIPAEGIGLGIMKDSELKHRLKEMLEFLDLGIDNVELREIEFNNDSGLTEEFKEYVQEVVKDIPENSNERAIFGRYGSEEYLTVDSENNYSAYELVTLHHLRHEDRSVAFNLAMESDGTRRLLELMPALLGLRNSQSEHVFVVDELDRSIHAHLSCKVLELFLQIGSNSRSQLIVTSHDTGLMDLDLLRRDEIWFMEKDRNGASSLYSLEEFKLPEKMNIEKGYLFGRFGAIPVNPSLDSLDWLREA